MKNLFLFISLFLACGNLYSQTTILMKKEGGVFMVPCKVNGLNLNFVFDTGASDVSISLTEAVFMLKNGFLSQDDLGEKVYYSIANGDIAQGTKIIIREIEFADLKLNNVEASIVHEISAPLLLGQSVIQKLGKIQLDGNELTVFAGKGNYDFSKFDFAKNQGSKKLKNGCFKQPDDLVYSGKEIFQTKNKCNLWETRNISDGQLLLEVPANSSLKLISRRFDYWQVEFNGKIGWLWEKNINLPECMFWLENL